MNAKVTARPAFVERLAIYCLMLGALVVVSPWDARGKLAAGTASQASWNLPPNPSVSDIFNARVFDEPLVPESAFVTPDDNIALAGALTAYVKRTNLDDFSSLTDFLARHSDSPWSASLLLHVGTEYYNLGHYTEALDAFRDSWLRYERISDPLSKAQADRALGELARMYSRIGRMTELNDLLAETANRPLTGPATQLIGAARDALWMMQVHPEVCFRCGPLALDRIRSHADPAKGGDIRVLKSRSTTNGFSLAQVAGLSRQLGMNYQMAFRSPGAKIVVPAVVHWNVGHFAAITDTENGRYLTEDYTFRGSAWISPAAIDQEASGYFIVPPGDLPPGWRAVGEEEAGKVWGKGLVNGGDQNGTSCHDKSTPECGQNCSGSSSGADVTSAAQPGGSQYASFSKSGDSERVTGMAAYSIHLMLISLSLKDTPVGYAPPLGPSVFFTVSYHQMEANQPATFYYSNLGPKWTCNWIDYITDNPTSPTASVTRYAAGGGTLNFGYLTAGAYANEIMTQAALAKTSTNSYEIQMPDGSKREYGQSDGSTGTTRRIFLTQVIDPAGNAVTLKYDSSLRITNIVDAIGQVTTLQYTNAAFPLVITSVTDPFGRSASFLYTTNGELAQTIDVLGLTSQFAYAPTNNSITALTTPYGTTAFNFGTSNGITWLQATDPLGESEFAEFNQGTIIPNGDPNAVVPHGIATTDTYLVYRDTFYWSKKAFADGAGDITKAKLYHWLHTPDGGSASRVLESEKEALENRVWYNYPGQTVSIEQNNVTMNLPSVVGRVLDDGTTQLYGYQYNASGNVTNFTDPVGRNYAFVYATNGVDLLATYMTRGGAAQKLTGMTYNGSHQALTITDASGQTTANTYNGRGQPASTVNPLGQMTSFTYDTNGYLLAITGPLQTTNDAVTFTYDSFGHVRTMTDIDGYTVSYGYDAMDRCTNITHPDGTFEQFVFGNLDLVASRDRLGRWTTNTYNADRQLTSTMDPLGRVVAFDWCHCGALTGFTDARGRMTSFTYDVQGRKTSKRFADGSAITYTYENTTSRLRNRRDAKGQDTVYAYYADNDIKSIAYPNALVTTPTVTFTYDTNFNRVLTMQDGIGLTSYAYNPITALPAPGAAWLASVTGPVLNSVVSYQYDALGRTTNRAINGVSQAIVFDALGRTVGLTNVLGSFQYAYNGATEHLISEIYPNGLTNIYTYYNNLGDDRLMQVQHFQPNGSLLSGFGYAFNAIGEITGLTNLWDTIPQRTWLPAYDAVDELTNMTSSGGPNSFTNFSYVYDFAGNRLMAATNTSQSRYSYNALNQVASGDSALLTDATFEWDAENRLTAINQGNNRSEFRYDGLGRRVEITEKTGGVVQTNNYYLWAGLSLCEVRDGTGATVLRRLFEQGEFVGSLAGGVPLYYTLDHLGSIREMLDGSANLVSRYDYGPDGARSVLLENQPATLGYGTMFLHRNSGLSLTLARQFDAASGRWLSRDLKGEKNSMNTYSYTENNPLNRVDLYGYDWQSFEDRLNLYALNTESYALDQVISAGNWLFQPATVSLLQGVQEGLDPTSLTSIINDHMGLKKYRCSQAYKVGQVIGSLGGLFDGATEIKALRKGLQGAEKLQLVTKGAKGNYGIRATATTRGGRISAKKVAGWGQDVEKGNEAIHDAVKDKLLDKLKEADLEALGDDDECNCGGK